MTGQRDDGAGPTTGQPATAPPGQPPTSIRPGVAAILRDADGRILLHRRRVGGGWAPPSGGVEPGEDLRTALHREIREELGVRITLGDEVVGPDDGAWRLSEKYVMRLWWAELASGTPEPLVEHDELRWLPKAHWMDVPWLDADVRIVEALHGT